MLANLRRKLKFHYLPPVILGSGGTSLGHKFQAVLHSMFLEAGSSAKDLANFCNQVVTGTSDLGTEFGLPAIQPVGVRELFPWAYPLHGGDEGPCDVLAESEQQLDEDVGLQRALAAPGLLHIIHNIGEDLLERLPTLDKAVTLLQDVATLLRVETTCSRLLETCYSSAVGATFHKALMKFKAKLYRARWGAQ